MTEDITLKESVRSFHVQDTSETHDPAGAFYQFVTHNPFADHQEKTSFFFEGGDRASQLDEAKHLSQFGNNIALITGDTGSGKTFFLEQACFELSDSASCCFISGTEDLTNEAIAEQISTGLSMPFATRQTIEQLIDMLEDADALEDVARFIIIVDDIHLLAEDIIVSLLHLSQISSSIFHLLASGLPSTFDYLERLPFQDNLIQELFLFPFSPEDTEAYLNFKMKSAGFKGEHYFDADTVVSIYKQSAGYPQKINQVAEAILLTQDHEQVDEGSGLDTSSFPLWHMIGAVFLLFLLILAFFYRSGITKELEPLAQTSTPTIEQDIPIQTVEEFESPNTIISPVDLSIERPSQASELFISTEINEAVEDKLVADENAIATNEAANLLIPENNIDTASLDQESTPETIPTNNLNISNASSIDTSVTEPTPSKLGFSQDEQTVLGWPDDHSTIQVIGALDKTSLEQYIADQANQKSLHLVTILRDEKPWHIVLADHYASNSIARQAIQRLPQNQVNAGPWIRSVSDLKQGIRDFRR